MSVVSEEKLSQENRYVQFPKLMEDSEYVVLFLKKSFGTIVFSKHNSKSTNLGFHSSTFNMKYFKNYQGTIALTNYGDAD